MSAESSPAPEYEWEITPEMLRAGYTVIGEFDPDITCLTSIEVVNTMLKAVYVAMCEVSFGVDISSAIEDGLALRPYTQD